MKVLLITGGISPERKISFISAKSVKRALEENNFQVKLFDLRNGFRKLKNLARNFDVIFPVLHGEEGEGGKLQKFLLGLRKPFVGGDPEGFKKGWHKIPFKKFCNKCGVLTAPWKEVKAVSDLLDFGLPAVLKQSSGGSSKEVCILSSKKDLKNGVCKRLLKSGQPLFVEKYIAGVEVTVSILLNKALPVIEIIPPKGSWFDYKHKYSDLTQEIPFAPSLTPKTQKKIQSIALKIHKSLNLGHYSRIDFIVARQEDSEGRFIVAGVPYVLEVNTIPGLTDQSLFPKAAHAANISFKELMNSLVGAAIKNQWS